MKITLVTILTLILILTACGQTVEPIDTDTSTSENTTNETSSTNDSESESSNGTSSVDHVDEAVEDPVEVPAEVPNDAPIELTLEELAAYNGKDGQPAYVAVDGIIYDMTNSKAWGEGQHNGFEAGKDLTEAINNVSPHGPSKLENVPEIGILIEASVEEAMEESVEEPVEDPVEAPVEEPAEAPVEEPVEEAAEAPMEEPTEEPAEPVSEEEDTPDELTLTTSELAAYNGKNGMPAYIAVDGIIYDVSHLSPWEGGEHNGNLAGLDLTDDLAYAPHGPEKLKKAIIVGKLVD